MILDFILSPYYWVKAINAIEQEDYLEAFNLLSKINVRATSKNYKYFLFKALSLVHLNDYAYAIDMLDKAEFILNKYHINNIDSNTLSYLKYYIFSLKASAFSLLGEEVKRQQYQKKCNEEKFQLSNVDNRVKNLFPIKT